VPQLNVQVGGKLPLGKFPAFLMVWVPGTQCIGDWRSAVFGFYDCIMFRATTFQLDAAKGGLIRLTGEASYF